MGKKADTCTAERNTRNEERMEGRNDEMKERRKEGRIYRPDKEGIERVTKERKSETNKTEGKIAINDVN